MYIYIHSYYKVDRNSSEKEKKKEKKKRYCKQQDSNMRGLPHSKPGPMFFPHGKVTRRLRKLESNALTTRPYLLKLDMEQRFVWNSRLGIGKLLAYSP